MQRFGIPGRGAWAGLRSGLLRELPQLSPFVLVVALLACVLIPLPTALVDLLLSGNLAASVLLLVGALRVRRATDMLVFPSLLLLTTLYRLALNISTTRLILSQADAGRVVEAFGSFVVRGDLIVGVVMFTMITIIQYLVIAKGAERVAEVAARFALDALPGHQAAIDADLRAGVIGPREAAEQRAAIIERSSFHGAMDGAMRFVKGDAIAGLAITATNLVGGVAVGSLRHGQDLATSLDTYGRLTIGDGLLAQIPALLVSLAASILVARVEQRTTPSKPWLTGPMFVVPVLLLLVLAATPGMPALAFVTTAIGLLAVGVVTSSRAELRERGVVNTAPERSILVRLPSEPSTSSRPLEATLQAVRSRVMDTLRIELPPLRLVRDGAPETLEVRFGQRLLRRTSGPAMASASAHLEPVVLEVFRALVDHGPVFVSLSQVDTWVQDLRAHDPVLVRRALERVALEDLQAIVHAFVGERLPLPRMEAILEVIVADRAFLETSERDRWADRVRLRLSASWLPDVIDGLLTSGMRSHVRLSVDLEEELRDATTGAGTSLQLIASPRAVTSWLERFDACRIADDGPRPAKGSAPPTPSPALVVTSPSVREAVSLVFRGHHPHAWVVSVAEFAEARIELPGPAQRVAVPFTEDLA